MGDAEETGIEGCGGSTVCARQEQRASNVVASNERFIPAHRARTPKCDRRCDGCASPRARPSEVDVDHLDTAAFTGIARVFPSRDPHEATACALLLRATTVNNPPHSTFARMRLWLAPGALLVVAIGAACSSGTNDSSASDAGGSDAAVADGSGDAGGSLVGDGGAPSVGPLAITPVNQTINVTYGSSAPTVLYKATAGGQPVPASFTIDLGQIATVGASSGQLAPTGRVGGVAHVTATYGTQKVSTAVTVVVHLVDNGAPDADAGAAQDGGAGGIGGVGGSGPGGPVSNPTQTALQGSPMPDPSLTWLYPYDKTVWPQGLLAPLLQWSTAQSYDAVRIHLQETGFQYDGYFSAPATPFVNHPILQLAWDTLSYSNQGEPIAINLVFETGGQAYGPLSETWTMAQGTLKGTVYYNSYGTALVNNYCCREGDAGVLFGGATLAIHHGSTSPVVVAGESTTPPDQSGCRVCHSVAALGATLISQHGDNYNASSAYALTSGNAETPMSPANGLYAYAGLSPDGTYLLSNAAPVDSGDITMQGPSALYAVPSGNPIASTGLPAGLLAGTPVFSPDTRHVAFLNYGLDQVSLGSLDFDPSTNTFSNPLALNTPSGGTDIYPAFLPTNDGVVFENEIENGQELGWTMGGAQGSLWWVDLKTQTAAPLANLNGGAYLPTGANNHGNDALLNYEPTISPVASGGYAWVVFTSRRLYGNVATLDPYSSDPSVYDLVSNVTTKKLWVAAIDLDGKPGTDPSHPAFYLPGQELYACNSRGYWVVDPCEPNGTSCLTGDECCSGTCQNLDGGLACSPPPSGCSALGNKCQANADCCGSSSGTVCIDGFCSMPTPQ
jgi:hypothetical protein